MSTKRKVVGTLMAVALLGIFATMAVTFSAFTSTTSNDNNQFRAGTVDLTDNDAGNAAFNMNGMVPGSTETKCIEVSYSGSLDSSVKLYGDSTSAGPGGDMAPYLDVEITRGSFPGAAPADMACDGFQADQSLFDNTLDQYPASYAAGIDDPDATWSTGDKAVYRIKVELNDDQNAEGTDAAADFTWEARDKGPA